MAVDLTQKQTTFIRAYIDAVDAMMNQMNTLMGLKEEWDANAYATGSLPPANNITDEVCAAIAPWIDAKILNDAVGGVTAVQNTVDSQRGYLEAIRP